MPLKVPLIIIACPVLVLVLALVAGIYLTLPAMQARRTLAKMESVQIGRSTFSEAQQIAEQIGADPKGVCSPAECEWVSWIGNITVPGWWRGQGEIFLASIHVKDGVVDQKELGYFIGFGSVVSDVSVTEKQDWPGDPKGRRWTEGEGTQGVHKIVFIRLTPSDPVDIRKKYTSFNWNCFWQYQGCKDEHELMPTGDW